LSNEPETSHNFIDLSADPLKKNLPSNEKATEKMKFLCSFNVLISNPDETSHNFIDLSKDPLKISFPSGEKTTENTAFS
jgi:hypothetical protein